LNNDKTTILLADDHAIVRRGIKALLEYEPDFAVIAEAGDGLQALAQLEAHQPHVLVTDLCMPNMSGIELLKAIKEKNLPVRSVVLSMCSDSPYIAGALDAGAYGYVLKESGVEHLVTAIREAQAGRRYLSPPLSDPEQAASGVSETPPCCPIDIKSSKSDRASLHLTPNLTFETGL
jgi:DNA-binding NarL/FixJ family response regulator